jgi:hypothetical protein
MTDVRLVATNPDDGVLVPVASNASGQLAVQSPKIEKIPNDVEVEGTVTATDVSINEDRIKLDSRGVVTAKRGSINEVWQGMNADANDVVTSSITGAGSAEFASFVAANDQGIRSANDSTFLSYGGSGEQAGATAYIKANGGAVFTNEVVIGSRSKTWLIRESNGVAMLVDTPSRGIEPRGFEKVRDLPRELDLIEAALNEVMEKLKMTPPAGWEVWDGSDNS